MKSLVISILLSCLCFHSIAQNGRSPAAGGRGAALANTGLIFEDIFASFSNQAGLAYIEGFTAGAVGEQRFLINEIRLVGAAAAYATNSGTFGLSLHYFGFEAFNEQKIGLNYGRLLTENLAIGAQINYLNTRIPNYGAGNAFSFELGLQATLADPIKLGVHISNPIRAGIIDEEPLATLLGIGVGYSPSKSLLVMAEVETELGFAPRFKMGIDYDIIDMLALRIGAATNPTIASFGLGLNLGEHIVIDFAGQYHLVLGFSPSIGLSYR